MHVLTSLRGVALALRVVRSDVARRLPTPDTASARERLGLCLALARRRAGLHQDHVVAALGVTRPTLSAWERGRTEPLALDLSHLADLYGITIDQLVGRAALPPPARRDT